MPNPKLLMNHTIHPRILFGLESTANVPEELIRDILLRLRVKPLLRFKCISKLLYSIISSKDFINTQFLKSSDKGIYRKLIHNSEKGRKIHILDLNDGSVEEFLLDFQIPPIRPEEAAYCNGLVLISIYSDLHLNYEFSVLNPSTRHYRKLPAFPEKLVYPDHSSYYTTNQKASFGYDAIADDYKVVVITLKNRTFQVWILELRSSCWRRIQDVPYFGRGRLDFEEGFHQSCYVDGSVHFLWRGHIGNSIVAFDIAKETFSMVSLPINYQTGSQVYPVLLQSFEGCLSIASCIGGKMVDFYVRTKEGVEFSWIKLFSFETQYPFRSGSRRILGYSKESDKILFSCHTSITISRLCFNYDSYRHNYHYNKDLRANLPWLRNYIHSYDLKTRTLQDIKVTNKVGALKVLCPLALYRANSEARNKNWQIRRRIVKENSYIHLLEPFLIYFFYDILLLLGLC